MELFDWMLLRRRKKKQAQEAEEQQPYVQEKRNKEYECPHSTN